MSDDDYKVGYGKPPKNTQFKKGSSGNPRGRSKKRPTFAEDLRAEFSEMIEVKEKGRAKRVSKQRALVKAILAAALSCNVRVLSPLMILVRMMESDPNPSAALDETDIVDLDVINKYIKERLEIRAKTPVDPVDKTSNTKN